MRDRRDPQKTRPKHSKACLLTVARDAWEDPGSSRPRRATSSFGTTWMVAPTNGTQMDYSKMFDHPMAVNFTFDGEMNAEEWVKKTRNFFLGRCGPTEWMLEWAEKRNAEIRPKNLLKAANEKGRRRTFSASRKRFGRSSTVVCQAKARSLSGWSRTSTAWRRGGA